MSSKSVKLSLADINEQLVSRDAEIEKFKKIASEANGLFVAAKTQFESIDDQLVEQKQKLV